MSAAAPAAGAGAAAPRPQVITAAVPRLDDLVIKCLAENYDIYPAIDYIPSEYAENVVALLDPASIELGMASKYIKSEKFWQRLAQERWPICEPAKHGNSWKRLYMERHVAALLEAYFPSKDNANMKKLTAEIDVCKFWVETIRLQQVLSHVNLSEIFKSFQNLHNIEITYGARKLGMDFDKKLFGMQLGDAMQLSGILRIGTGIHRLRLSECLINDETLHVLISGLQQNETITHLDLSHNKINDSGAQRFCRLLHEESVLREVDLSDNAIHADGAKALGKAVAANDSLEILSLRLCPIGDNGGAEFLNIIADNQTLKRLNLASTGLEQSSAKALINLIQVNRTLESLDISCNEVCAPGKALRVAVTENGALVDLELRKNTIDEDELKTIRDLLYKRMWQRKRLRRLAFQQGWDEAV